MKKAALLSLAIIGASANAALADWNGMKWGQSPEDTKTALGGAVAAEGEDLVLHGIYPMYGEPRILAEQKVGPFAVEVVYIFHESGGVEQLTAVAVEFAKPGDGDRAYGILEDQYGAALVREVLPDNGCSNIRTKWRDEDRGNNVAFEAKRCGPRLENARIIYSPIMSRDDTGL